MALAAQGATPVSPDPAGDLERSAVTESSCTLDPGGREPSSARTQEGSPFLKLSWLLPGHVSPVGTGSAGLPSLWSPTLGGSLECGPPAHPERCVLTRGGGRLLPPQPPDPSRARRTAPTGPDGGAGSPLDSPAEVPAPGAPARPQVLSEPVPSCVSCDVTDFEAGRRPSRPASPRLPAARGRLTCGMVVCHPATLHADLEERLQPPRLPVPHAHAHRLGGSAKPGACVERGIPGLRPLCRGRRLWKSSFHKPYEDVQTRCATMIITGSFK